MAPPERPPPLVGPATRRALAPGLAGEDPTAHLPLALPHIQSYARGGYGRPADALGYGPPGDGAVDRAFLGAAPKTDRVLTLRFEDKAAFLSTDRAALPPRQRPPVADVHRLLLREGDAGWAVVDALTERRLVPLDVALASMVRVEAHPAYRDALRLFGDAPYATRLAQRRLDPPPRPKGLLRRLLAPPPEPDPPLPPRQIKWILEQWLPPGAHRYGDVFHRAREVADTVVETDAPLLAWTIELWELSGPRYVHWHFHGTLLRLLECPERGEVVAWESFRTG